MMYLQVTMPEAVSYVRFQFTSNYGNDNTCVYRVQVHGTTIPLVN